MKSLKDKIALVTGAGSGIGRATAVELAREGCRVVLNDIEAEPLRDVEQEIVDLGRRALVSPADVSKLPQVEKMCADALAAFDRVDILVNNAGFGVGGDMQNIPLEDWDNIIGVNLLAHIYTVKLLLPQMLGHGEGHLVHVSSAAGMLSVPFLSPYCVTKHAVVGLAESLAAELSPKGIGVTLVCPSPVQTPIMRRRQRIYFSSKDDEYAAMKFMHDVVDSGMRPEKLAKKIVRAIYKNQYLISTSGALKAVVIAKAFFPSAGYRFSSLLSRTMRWYFLRKRDRANKE